MALNITQKKLDHTDLVVLAGRDGTVQWSSNRERTQVTAMLRDIADSIEDGTL